MKHDRDNIRDNILCTCFGQKLFLDTGHFFAKLVSILTTKEGREEEKEKGREEKQNETRDKWKNGGRLAEREGKAGEEGRHGGGGRWESEAHV